MPSRLLEVSPDSGPNHIRLVEITSGGQWLWACLSYVWGGDQRYKTTRNILPEYLKGICFEMLPQTIKDAVSVCRELRIPYLWIDSLCIVQDDEGDKEREIPQMGLVYQHARLTIAAAKAHNVNEGFLERPLCYRRLAPTSIRFRDRCGKESETFVLTEKQRRSDGFHRPKEPLDARAWALQEQLLSPRLLSYTSHGPLWSCQALSQLVNEQTDEVDQARYSGRSLTLVGGWRLGVQSWESFVRLYSRRQATLHSDRLVALSAVAQIYSESKQNVGAYLAGIWKNSIPLSLLWNVETRDISPRSAENTAPTWSWASVSGPVRYDWTFYLRPDDDFKLILVQTRPVNSNEFGAVMDGTLVVDAKVRNCCIKNERKMWAPPRPYFQILDGSKIQFKADTREFWFSICTEDTEVMLLLVASGDGDSRSGLVLFKNSNSDSFSRVSYFEAKCEDQEIASQREYDEFFERFEIKRVTII